MLAKSTDSDTLSNRVVHVSVQLFSNEDLAYEMTKNHDLLKIMITSLHAMMIKIAHNSTLQCKFSFFTHLWQNIYFDSDDFNIVKINVYLSKCFS